MDVSAVLRTFAAMASAASPVPRAARRRCEELRRYLEADSGGDVQVRETHVSWVLLTDAHAYKLKKPVRFGFVDQSTVEMRRRGCHAEVEVNRALAPAIVLGVRPLLVGADGVCVGQEGEGPAVDWVVLMRRFDENSTLAARVRRGDVPASAMSRIARRIAAFHSTAEAADPVGWPDKVLATWDRNLEELEPLVPEAMPDIVRAARRFGRGFVARRRADLAARAAAGLVRDGHGDLRAEHVVLDGNEVTIVDRLEFDPALRRVDVADDLAFLVMDLESLGAAELAAQLVDRYEAAGGNLGDDALLSFFAAYRALVRAKVRFLRPGGGRTRAPALLRLAERRMWRARGPLTLAISGPPASGKSTLAEELAGRTGHRVLSSDVIRKERLGLSPAMAAPPSAYAPAARWAVYEELGRRARAAARSGGVIVDATFGEPSLREAFLAGAGAELGERLRVVECRAALDVMRARAAARRQRGGSPSDADDEVTARLAGSFNAWPLPAAQRLVLSTDAPASVLVERCAAWLDGADRRSA